MKQFIVILFLSISSISISAQNNINRIRISIITCGPGDELYSLFGHTALRIIDSTAHQDIVYNWGGFTFDPPVFYLKFMRGKLLYYSFADNFPDFMAEYVEEHRSVYEQVLDLDSASKQKILHAVMYNTEGENRFYKYDFLLDNCTTRVRNIVFENNKEEIIKDKIVPDKTTARDMIHYYLDRGSKPWTELGIDILLGGRVDRAVSNNEAMFMPEFLMKGLSEAKKQDTTFVKNTKILLQEETEQPNSGKFLPLIFLAIISLVIFIISRSKAAWAKNLISFVDALLLYITGLIGLLILFMWFGTDHTVCKNNFNLAWALPFNLPVAFSLTKKQGWLSNYFFIAAVITAVLVAAWFWLPQQMNIALLPIVILLLNRYVNLANKYRRIA